MYFLLRPESAGKADELRASWGVGAGRAIAVQGDLTQGMLGVKADDINKLQGQISHFYHLAAVYDLQADEESQISVNIDGTRNTVKFAKAIDAGHFHHVSSIAAAGLYEGVFREDMFEEAENYEHPYFRTKHESEKIVRTEYRVPWTVFRPAMVVGHSLTGEMDKIDGPYYYFGSLRVTMGLLPGMTQRGAGHVVNVSSIGVLTNAPRFSAYVASKAALDAWTRCASSEFADVGISFTTINMPLVRTPMIAPTNVYNNVPTLAPEEAAELVAQACIFKPVRIATRLGIAGQVLHALMPRIAQIAMNTSFRMFADSSAAKGEKGAKDVKPKLSPEALAMQQMMRGVHF